jgi:protein associated with RNAse G/E
MERLPRSTKMSIIISISSKEGWLTEEDLKVYEPAANRLLDGPHFAEYHRHMRYPNVAV